MSRIGRLPIPVPSGVDVSIQGADVTVKGPKGSLTHTLATPITIDHPDSRIISIPANTGFPWPPAFAQISFSFGAIKIAVTTQTSAAGAKSRNCLK